MVKIRKYPKQVSFKAQCSTSMRKFVGIMIKVKLFLIQDLDIKNKSSTFVALDGHGA